MTQEDRYTARVTCNMTPEQKADLQRIADKARVGLSWLVRRSLERTIEEANGGPMLPLDMPGGRLNAA